MRSSCAKASGLQKGERYSELAQRLAFHSVSERLALALLDTGLEADISDALSAVISDEGDVMTVQTGILKCAESHGDSCK